MAGMLREEEDTSGSRGRKMFWRSASWSSSRTAQQNSSHFENVNDCADRDKNNGGQFGRYPLPVTPRSQQNCKARACLPPLQPLSIARRSLDEWPKAGSDDVGVWPQPPTPSGRGDLSRLKLDLSSFQKNPDPTASLVNRDRIAYFDKECSKVADHIYLGGDAVAKNRDILRQNGITHVLNCVGFVCPEYFKADLVYKTLWLQDSPSEDITSILYDVFDYFEDVREQGGRVFVHCCQGVSRSTSLVIAYLMWREGQSFDDAFQYVKAARGIANPNMGFACQLLQCQKRVHAIPLSPSSLLRMYRIAPHSPYDPLHLVPKMLNDPSPSALDSRGAFIIHVPSAIYIWIGKTCEPIMERDAKGAAFQVVRYERVQGQIIIVKEGCEPSEFWDAFCSLPHSLDKSCNGVQVGKEQLELAVKINPGDRKVEAYDAEFELLQKATSGGIVPPFSLSETGHETHLPTRESNWSVLRRKFVSAPKIPLFRVYSDSVLMIDSDNHVNKLSALSADSSTSSSPSYLSPSSFSSDLSSSSRFSADSLSLSPSTSSRSLTPSPGPSPLADSSLSIKNSILPVTTNPKTLSITNTTKLPSQAVLPSKPSILSLAERRGGLLASFKLPILNDVPSFSSRRTKIGSLACQQDESEGNYKLDGLCCKDELSDSKEGSEREKGDVLLEDCLIETLVRDGSSCEHETYRESRRNCPLQECEPSILTGLVNNGFHLCNGIQPIVRRWPGFVKVAAFDAGFLDSNFVYLFLASSAGVDRHADKMLYFWMGKSFKLDKSQSELNNSKNISEAKDFDCNQIAFEFFTLMSLPKEIPVKEAADEVRCVNWPVMYSGSDTLISADKQMQFLS